jgi:hypothetical protein
MCGVQPVRTCAPPHRSWQHLPQFVFSRTGPTWHLQGPTHIRPGYELGVTPNNKEFYIFNHLVFNVLIHKTDGVYTRAQSSAYTNSLAVDTSGRRLLAWPHDTPAQVRLLVLARAQRLRGPCFSTHVVIFFPVLGGLFAWSCALGPRLWRRERWPVVALLTLVSQLCA